MGKNIGTIVVAALCAAGCVDADGRGGVAGWMGADDSAGGKGDSPVPGAAQTCLQALADGAPLPGACTAEQLHDDFEQSPLGPIADLREIRVVDVDGLPGSYVDLAVCRAGVELWTGAAAPLVNLVPSYADAGGGCHWVPAEDLVGVAFLYIHNHGAYVYNAAGEAPSEHAQEAAWRFFVQYPDTVTQLFAYDVNFGFSYVNRALELYVQAHPELGYAWFGDAVDAYVIDEWGLAFADVIKSNNGAHALPTTMAGDGLVAEFDPPLPNAMARAGLVATAEVWNRPGAWTVRLAAAVRLSELGEPFSVPANLVSPDLRGLNRLQGPVAAVIDASEIAPPSKLADASDPLITVPADPSLPSANTLAPAWLSASQVSLYWASQEPATLADFDSFYESLMTHPEGTRVSPDVTWHPDTVLDVSKEPIFHLEYAFKEVDPASVEDLVRLDVRFTNGRAAGTMAQTAPGASRAVLLEEMFHTGQPFAESFSDIQNFDNEIAFRQFALDPDNLRALGFHNNAEQIALWRHDLAVYRMLRQMATNP